MMLLIARSDTRALACSFGARSPMSRRASASSSLSVLRPACGPEVTRLGKAENDDGVTETIRPSRTAIDWVRWCPSRRKPHAPVSAGVPKKANENRSEERWPAPLPLAARMSCSSMTFFVLARPAGDSSVDSSSQAAAFCAGRICSSRRPGLMKPATPK